MVGRRSGGPETYELQLLRALCQQAPEDRFTAYCVNDTAESALSKQSPELSVRTLRPSLRWISFTLSLPLELLRRPVDVFHATYVAPPYVPGKFVFTLHDLSPFSNPEMYPAAIRFRLQRGFASSIRWSDAVLCVSEFTRNHLLEMFPEAVGKAHVTHHGLDPVFGIVQDRFIVQRCLQRYGVDCPYVLCLGKVLARKNTGRVLEAFHKLKQETKLPHKLLVVGRRMWTSSDIGPLIARLGLEPHVIFTGHVPDEDIPLLYNGADALAFPSLFEGFGFPILEAMACGCPVVTSNVTSLPEVAGGAAIIVNPYRVDEIAEGLYRALTDEPLRADLISRGILRSREFTWQKTAADVLRIYRQVA